jgi:hypothetical protein
VSDRYDLIIKPVARCALTEVLAPSVAFAAWEFINGPLRNNPQRVRKRWSRRFRATGRRAAGITGSVIESTTTSA